MLAGKETTHTAARRSTCAVRGHSKAIDRGQTLLEFVLLAPVLLLIASGVVDVGRAIFYTVAVNNAATAGVEYGAQSSAKATDTTGMQNAATLDAHYSGMSAVATYGCTCDTGNGTSCTYPVPPTSTCGNSCAGTQVECVQVTTTANINTVIAWPGLPSGFTANGAAVRRVRENN